MELQYMCSMDRDGLNGEKVVNKEINELVLTNLFLAIQTQFFILHINYKIFSVVYAVVISDNLVELWPNKYILQIFH